MTAEIIPFPSKPIAKNKEISTLQRLEKIAENLGIDIEAVLRGGSKRDR